MFRERIKVYGLCLLLMLYQWIVWRILFFLEYHDIEILMLLFPIVVGIISIQISRACYSRASDYRQIYHNNLCGIVCRIAGWYNLINSGMSIWYFYFENL